MDLSAGHIRPLSFTTVYRNSGGHSGGLGSFEDLSVPVPRKLKRPPGYRREDEALSDPDLYLTEIDIPNMEHQIENSLREAVLCFRHGLYTACLAMLGKASEGAWIELGRALAILLPGTNKSKDKYENTFTDPYVGIGKKIAEAVKLFEQHDLVDRIKERSGVRPQDLRNALVWADAVRESRNSVHYGVEPAMKNGYEKVAALLIAAVPHLKIVYAVRNAANALRS